MIIETQLHLDEHHTVDERFHVLKEYFRSQPKKVQYREYLLTIPIYRSLKLH